LASLRREASKELNSEWQRGSAETEKRMMIEELDRE